MNRIRLVLITIFMLMLSAPLPADIYINMNAPGIHKEYDKKLGKEVWKNARGRVLGEAGKVKSLQDLDERAFLDPAFKMKKKVWDKDNNCYKWRDVTLSERQNLYAKTHNICYVNMNAPGVHKEYDKKLGKMVWKSGSGSVLADVENARPMHEMDKYVYAGDDVDKSPYMKKVWDRERGCYVWKDNMGNFMGRDKKSSKDYRDWVTNKNRQWFEQNERPKSSGNHDDGSTIPDSGGDEVQSSYSNDGGSSYIIGKWRTISFSYDDSGCIWKVDKTDIHKAENMKLILREDNTFTIFTDEVLTGTYSYNGSSLVLTDGEEKVNCNVEKIGDNKIKVYMNDDGCKLYFTMVKE
ncbi:hypothetical protein [Prevotella sp. OH937_COT-195]|uniref:hypothetical protein n=1 Tax=Prevotella sp. OH937_COT-195 TaxID=2491051 RepID=UPI000F64C7BB|nr:hypothetical protein [Prevotella sp. OH937_COT-195]RRC99851.1 hypothetical protein EII32_07305 [Prevotella sp. OH937_COT-195]